MTDFEGDLRDLVGPDRKLACGCEVINGAICLVDRSISGFNAVLYTRSGRIIHVEGPKDEHEPGCS